MYSSGAVEGSASLTTWYSSEPTKQNLVLSSCEWHPVAEGFAGLLVVAALVVSSELVVLGASVTVVDGGTDVLGLALSLYVVHGVSEPSGRKQYLH